MTSKKADSANTMTKREYAAIHLRVPDSGTDWIDAMILRSEQCGATTNLQGDSDGGTPAGPKGPAKPPKAPAQKTPPESGDKKMG